MTSMRATIVGLLFFLPFVIGWILLYRLSAYRRDGRGLVGTLLTWNVRVLRPDLYTDEGQRLLRWAWAVLLMTIPWCVTVGLLVG